MTEEIISDIFRIEIPLPDNPLKITNAYLIRGQDKNLLVDTGFNRAECREAMMQGLSDIGCGMDNTDLFLTHMHSDHTGLTGFLAKAETRIYGSERTALSVTARKWGVSFRDLVIQSGLAKMGLPPDDTTIHQGYLYAADIIGRTDIVKDGDVIELGGIRLRCVETSGHAPGHMCLYEPDRKLFFSGDHILSGITPNNTIWEAPWEVKLDYLGIYLQNLDKIAAMDIELVLPGHRAPIQDCNGRIAELKEHHYKRLNNILDILGDKKMSGAEVASHMSWNMRGKTWGEFPNGQKYFATGEALSHLSHLVFQARLSKELVDGVVYYAR